VVGPRHAVHAAKHDFPWHNVDENVHRSSPAYTLFLQLIAGKTRVDDDDCKETMHETIAEWVHAVKHGHLPWHYIDENIPASSPAYTLFLQLIAGETPVDEEALKREEEALEREEAKKKNKTPCTRSSRACASPSRTASSTSRA